jgi:DAK2 domain fusion protein YloV
VLERLRAAEARRWAVVARAVLGAHRAELDALNVFPVADADTGTNLYLTLDAALEGLRTEQSSSRLSGETSLARECAALADAMLLTARGNSGVILSQLVRGFAEGVAGHGSQGADRDEGADGVALAAGLRRASELAWASVGRPVEGTILSVARAAAQEAETAAGTQGAGGELTAVARAAARGAHLALAATPGQLPPLGRAGVVDAGGAGYTLLLESLLTVVTGEAAPAGPLWRPAAAHPQAPSGAAVPAAYEVMYLLADAPPEQVEGLRRALDALGDSVMVVGGPELWNVHVHAPDAGAAIEAGMAAGRPHRIRVTVLSQGRAEAAGEPVDAGAVPDPRRPGQPPAAAVLACAPGPGLAAAFAAAGATVLEVAPGRPASAARLLAAAVETRAASVIVLPNDPGGQQAAQAAAAAAEQDGVAVHVVRSCHPVQGIAAAALFDPTISITRNVAAMSSAAASTRHGGVMIADGDALTSAGPCRAGDVLGVVGDDIALVGADVLDVALAVVRRLLSSGGDLVTLVPGADAPPDIARRLLERLSGEHRGVETAVVDGGQPGWPLLVGVE